jgi:hypothetical protein
VPIKLEAAPPASREHLVPLVQPVSLLRFSFANLLLSLLWIGDLISMASTCYRPITDNRTHKSIVELGFQFLKAPHPSDASVFGCAARFNLSTMKTSASSTDLRSAEIPEDRAISDSADDDDDLPSRGQIPASSKQVIDLTGDDDNDTSDDDDDDDDGESDDELPSVKRIPASASSSSKQSRVLPSPKQAANLTHENDDESGGDDGNLPEVT